MRRIIVGDLQLGLAAGEWHIRCPYAESGKDGIATRVGHMLAVGRPCQVDAAAWGRLSQRACLFEECIELRQVAVELLGQLAKNLVVGAIRPAIGTLDVPQEPRQAIV